jgi:hypothetical protein
MMQEAVAVVVASRVALVDRSSSSSEAESAVPFDEVVE